MDRIFTKLIPNHFLNSEDAFRAKVVWVFSSSVGSIALIIIVGLMLVEGSVPLRRLGTLVLACSLLLVTVLIRYAKQLISVSSYVVCMTTIMMFYLDFINASVFGPTSVLWVVPFTLMALLFSGKRLGLMVVLTLALFALNILALTKGWLPESIIAPETGHFARAVFILASIIIVMISTLGVTKLASAHLSALNKEIKNKQARIETISELKR